VARSYRASINLDFTKQDTGAYQALIRALIQAGWVYVETSALVVETDDIGKVWRGVELVAKGSQNAGELSAFTFHIQSSKDFAGVPYKGAATRANALTDILQRPFPVPK